MMKPVRIGGTAEHMKIAHKNFFKGRQKICLHSFINKKGHDMINCPTSMRTTKRITLPKLKKLKYFAPVAT
jgi:hypothetical protein